MFWFGLRLVFRTLIRRFGKSAVTFVGVAFAVASLVALEAVMQGVSDAMVSNSVALHHGHVQASWPPDASSGEVSDAALQRIVGFRTALRRKRLDGTLVHGPRQIGITLYGIVPEDESRETVVAGKVVEGDYLGSEGEILLGAAAAHALGAGIGDRLQYWRKDAQPLSFRIGGLFNTGIGHMDSRMVFVRLSEVADVEGVSNELSVFLAPNADLDLVAKSVRRQLPAGASVATWQESFTELVQLVSLNQVAMNVVLALALLILVFGVSNTVFISVTAMTRELGILKAMGFTPAGIAVLVLAEVLILVSLAGIAGVGLGAGISAVWSLWGLDLSTWTSANPHFIASGIIYPRVVARSLVLPMLVAVSCGLLAGSVPAIRAGRLSVVQALRTI